MVHESLSQVVVPKTSRGLAWSGGMMVHDPDVPQRSPNKSRYLLINGATSDSHVPRPFQAPLNRSLSRFPSVAIIGNRSTLGVRTVQFSNSRPRSCLASAKSVQ